MARAIDRKRLQQLVGDGAQLVEVLPEEEYLAQHLPGALSIPLTKLDRSSATRLGRDRPVIVYCADSG